MPTPKLPKSLQEIERLAGTDLALSLALACGGSRVYVPNKIEGSTLEKLLGAEMARKLARHMPGCSIPVPIARRGRRTMAVRSGSVGLPDCGQTLLQSEDDLIVHCPQWRGNWSENAQT